MSTIEPRTKFAQITDKWGRFRSIAIISPDAPEVSAGEDGFMWLDTSTPTAPVLKVYDEDASAWRQVGAEAIPLTTKGDVYGYDTDGARVPVGTDDQILTADSGETLGIKWANPTWELMSTNMTVTPAPDGVETVFTVSGDEYAVSTLIVAVNGQLQTKDIDFAETAPTSGTFTFQAGSIPQTDDIIRVFFGLPGVGAGVVSGSGTSGKVPRWTAASTLADGIISDDGSKITLSSGTGINEFSIDDTLSGDSDDVIPTEQAVKAYADTKVSSATLTTKGDIFVRGASTIARLGVGTNDQVVTADSAEALGMKWAAAGGGGSDYIHIRDEKAQTTPGGTFTSGAWRTRDLNVEVSDDGEHASLASNQITLAAGTYVIQASAPAFYVGYQQAALYNVTDAAYTMYGTSEFARGTTGGDSNRSFLSGQFTIADSKVFEIRHQCGSTNVNQGFGVPSSFATEVYTVVELWKTA